MKKTLQIISFILIIIPAYTQHFNFRNFSIDEGLPQSTVYDLFQDNKGFIWFGTQGGVAKFDGIKFTNFSQKNGLAGNHVFTICQDKNKYIWTGHRYDGISCIHNDTITTSHPKELKSDVVSITHWKDGVIAITKSSKLFYLELTGNKIITKQVENYNNFQLYHVKAKAKKLYIATNKGLLILNQDLQQSNILLKNKSVYDFQWNDHGALILAINNGIVTFSNNKIIKETSLNDTYDRIIATKSGDLWLSNKTGALSIKGDIHQRITKKNGISNDEIECLLEDNEGNIWFGLNGTGASQFVAVKFETFDISQGIQDDQIQSVLMDHLSRLWISGNNTLDVLEFHEHSSFSLKNVIHLSKYLKLECEDINFIFQDSKLFFWLGTDNGVYVLDSNFKIIKHLTTDNGLSNNFIISIAEDDENNIWMASLYHGITKVSSKNGHYSCLSFDKESGLCSNSFWTVFTDNKGIVYMGSNDAGISFWNGQNFNTINEKQGLTNLRAGSITEDLNGNLWIGTIGGGIFKYNGEHCTQYTTKDGLSADNPYFVICDDIGNLWVGTNTGVDVMSINKTNNNKNLFKHYGANQGFLGVETNQNSKFKDQKGNLWFGTVKGVIQCNANEIREDTTPPQIHITGKKLFLKDNISLSNKVLNYNENHITFEYIGLHFTNPHQVKYQYKLENFDKDWSPWSNSTSATFSYLFPGKYKFTFKAANGDHFESKIISYDFEILPPFWNTLWFYILTGIIIAIIYILIIRMRTVKIKKDKKILENKVTQRTKELNDEKQVVINQKEIIELKNKNITDSINYAKTIQESVLPDTKILNEYFNDSFIYYKPRDIVSGDFYWFKKYGDYFIIAAADCTGHGIPGAFLAMLGSELLNQITIIPNINAPSKAITLLDQGIYSALNRNKGDFRHDGIDISICVFNKKDDFFHYSGARRPILVSHKNEIKIYEPIPCSIGEIKDRNQTPFDNKIQIKKGDRIYMFSDGYVDQFGGPKNKKFLLRRFIDLIKENQKIKLEHQKNIFDKTFIEWTKDNEQLDDILVMAIEV